MAGALRRGYHAEKALTPVLPFAAEGADGHCQPLARALTEQRVYDWLDGFLRA